MAGVPTRESLDKGGEKVIVTTDPNEGFGPDGLTKDSNLNPWAVILGGGKVVNFDAQVVHLFSLVVYRSPAPALPCGMAQQAGVPQPAHMCRAERNREERSCTADF